MEARKSVVVVEVMALAPALSVRAVRADIPLGIVLQDTPTGSVVTDVVQGAMADRVCLVCDWEPELSRLPAIR
jgi:hypothetical protein